jgi:CRP-like cAMP-binding protein
MPETKTLNNNAPNKGRPLATEKYGGQVKSRKIKSGQYIFREGELGDIAFIVCTGTIEILKKNNSGELVLGIVRQGGMFGEMALIDEQPRMASSRAKDGDAEVMVITREMLEKKLSSVDPFVKALVSIMSSHIRTLASSLMEVETNAS